MIEEHNIKVAKKWGRVGALPNTKLTITRSIVQLEAKGSNTHLSRIIHWTVSTKVLWGFTHAGT